MTLYLERVKIMPSLLQELIEKNKTTCIDCHLLVPVCDKSFKIDLSSCKRSKKYRKARTFDSNQHTCKYICSLQFPLNKVIRGLHPTMLQSFNSIEMSGVMAEQLESWISLYDVELSSYQEGDIIMMSSINYVKNRLILVQFRRTYKDVLNNELIPEYLYYMTALEEYDEQYMKQAFIEYDEQFNTNEGNREYSYETIIF